MNKMFKDFKQQRADQWEELKLRKKGDEGQRRARNREMMEKLARSQKAVEDFMNKR